MKVLQKTADYTIYQKRSGRYAIRSAQQKWINGEEKVKILLDAGLIKIAAPQLQPEPAEESAAPAENAEAAAVEEAPAEAEKSE